MNEHHSVDVIVVGAGPSGLSCAIEAKKAGLSVLVLEKGGIAEAIRRFPVNLVWFSTPELLEIGNIPFLVPTTRPTRVDTLNYYQRVVRHFALDVRTHEEVTGLQQCRPGFEVQTRSGNMHHGRTVIVATGYFDCPNWLGVEGEHLPHVRHYYHEPFEYAGDDVIVVGGRNSAVEAALDLYRHGARVTLIHRGGRLSEGVKYWILPDMENRIRNNQIVAFFDAQVTAIRPGGVVVKSSKGEEAIPARFVFVLVGFHPDADKLRSLGVNVDAMTLAPCINEATFETNIQGLYVAGSIVAGKDNNKVFVENGRMHAFTIIPEIQRRLGEQ